MHTQAHASISILSSNQVSIMIKPAVIMLISIVIMAFGIKTTVDDSAFEQRGREAPVQLSDGYTEVTTKQGVSTRSIAYEADLTFIADGRQTITVHKSVPQPLLQDLLSGKQVMIDYLSDDPYKNRFGTERGPSGMGWLWFSAFVFIVGLIWFFISYKSDKSEREYLESRRRSIGRLRRP
jgi:hypothetical protein